MKTSRPFLLNLFAYFIEVDTFRLAASLAFYVTLSLTPLILIFLSLLAHLRPEWVDLFDVQIRHLTGANAQNFFASVVKHSQQKPILVSMSGLLGLLSMLISSGVIFAELRSDLNKIFAIKTVNRNENWVQMTLRFFRDQLSYIGMILSFLLLLILSLVLSSMISSTLVLPDKNLALILNLATSLLIYILFFTLMLRYIPDKRLGWFDSFRGGALISVLFLVGKELIGIYIGESIGSTYGTAGSAIVILVWLYYSALIVFLGAETTALMSKSTTRLERKT